MQYNLFETTLKNKCFGRCMKNLEMRNTCLAVREKYLNNFAKTKDLYFYLRTSAQFHLVAPKPFMINGTFQPKKITQAALGL